MCCNTFYMSECIVITSKSTDRKNNIRSEIEANRSVVVHLHQSSWAYIISIPALYMVSKCVCVCGCDASMFTLHIASCFRQRAAATSRRPTPYLPEGIATANSNANREQTGPFSSAVVETSAHSLLQE